MEELNQDGSHTLPRVFFDAIQYFAHSGDVGCLLAPQRMLLSIHNANGDTALHTALLAGRSDAALAFVRVMAADDLDTLNSDGQSALHVAAQLGNNAVIEALVTRGANVHLVDPRGNTAAHLATSADVLRTILRCAGASRAQNLLATTNADGFGVLHLAASQGRLDLVLELVVRQCVDINQADCARGRTALHHAVRAGSRPCCELLLEFGADISATDNDGNTALHLAVQHDLYDITKALVDFGADCVHVNAYFQTPVDVALLYGSINAHSAFLATPAIRQPTRSLRAVALVAFPGLFVAAPVPPAAAAVHTTASPAMVPVNTKPIKAVSPTIPARAQSPPERINYESVGGETDNGAQQQRAHRTSDPEWQFLSNDDLDNKGETEWHIHKNKKFGSALGALTRKIAGKDRDKEREKEAHAATAHGGQRAREGVPLRSASTGASGAKADKARLAAQYGVPDVTVGPGQSAKEEKKALEQKYNPKIELQVMDQGRRATPMDPGSSKAAEVAAQAAVHSSRTPAKLDELSTLD